MIEVTVKAGASTIRRYYSMRGDNSKNTGTFLGRYNDI